MHRDVRAGAAASRALRVGRTSRPSSWIEWVKDSGIHVVGDLDDLRPLPLPEDEPYVNPDKVPARRCSLGAAVDALSAMTREAASAPTRGTRSPAGSAGPASSGDRPADARASPTERRGPRLGLGRPPARRRYDALAGVVGLRRRHRRVPRPLPARAPSSWSCSAASTPRGIPTPVLAESVLTASAAGPRPARPRARRVPEPTPRFGPRAGRSLGPASPASCVRVAASVLADQVVAAGSRPRPSRGTGPRLWRRGYRLVGDPAIADPLRDQLVAKRSTARRPSPRVVWWSATDLAHDGGARLDAPRLHRRVPRSGGTGWRCSRTATRCRAASTSWPWPASGSGAWAAKRCTSCSTPRRWPG